MITVAGKRPDSGTLAGFADGSLKRNILSTMETSTHRYAFDTAAQLEFELALRQATVEAAHSLYGSGLRFAVFRDAAANPAYWNVTRDGGFSLKRGAPPARAILDIFENGSAYATECATAMMIVLYGALVKVYGEARFNRLFPQIELMNWHRLDPRLQSFGSLERKDDYFPGDRRYIANPDVDPLTPHWQGENVIELGGGLFYGHGIGIRDAGSIIRSLNRNRVDGATRSAYLMDAAGRPDYQRLAALAAP